MNEKIEDSCEDQKLNKDIEKKKDYSAPKLLRMGSMQRITLGGSEAVGDSGQQGDLLNN